MHGADRGKSIGLFDWIRRKRYALRENENREAGQDDGSAGAQSDSETSDQDADATGGQTQDETAPASTNVPVQYTVQPGDTLLAISKRVYGTDQMVGKICAANGINDGDKILAGQKILLP